MENGPVLYHFEKAPLFAQIRRLSSSDNFCSPVGPEAGLPGNQGYSNKNNI
jgi:hypothetical protein